MNGESITRVNSIEEWERHVDASIIGTGVGHAAISTEIEEPAYLISNSEIPNSERFPNYPNRRESLKGKNQQQQTTFASWRISRDFHDCALEDCGHDVIEPGEEYVVVQFVQEKRQGEDHWHLHSSCFQDKVLNTLQNVHPLKANQTTPARLYEHRKKLINSNRRKGIVPAQ